MQDSSDTPPSALDAEIADQLFAVTTPDEQTELRAMLREMLSDVSRRLDALRDTAETATPAEARHELHQLKGNAASFGFSLSAAHIARLENDWDSLSPDTRIRLLTAGIEDLHSGAAELTARHDYLVLDCGDKR